MGSPEPSWRVPRTLRSVFLAGAAALAWLAFAAPAADADSDSGSLLGGITSTVSSATTAVSAPVENTAAAAAGAASAVAAPVPLPAPAPAPAPADPLPSGTVVPQPVVGSLTGAVDTLIGSVPVVNEVVPGDTVTSVVTPVVTLAEDAASALTETVLPPVAETLPVLDTLLPVTELVTDSVGQSPASGVESGIAADVGTGTIPSGAAGDSAALSPLVSTPPALWGADSSSLLSGTPLALTGAVATSGSSAPLDGAPEPSWPQVVPAMPGSSGGQSSGQPSGPAACLPSAYLSLPKPDADPAHGPSQHAPSPVAFDPGSSPD